MTGAELIYFIKANALESEAISVEYFSFAKKLKYCGGCSSLVKLSNFHKGTGDSSPNKSSHYRYFCKMCVSKAAFQKKYTAQKSKKQAQTRATKKGLVR